MSDLFNNPMVNNALKNMSKEELENYKKIGEQMYGNIDFVDSKIIKNNLPPPVAEAIAYVEEGIKSGLMPVDLEEDEVIMLTKAYGTEWYEKYGWKRHEVPEPGLSLANKQEIDQVLKEKIAEAQAKYDKKNDKKK
jgi:hypothetical protein